jgi:hypothetical protein
MRWHMSHRADPMVLSLADRHYNRQKVGSPQFVPPGRCVVFLSDCCRAFWVTSWPFEKYVKHEWGGAWVCSAFRSEGAGVASELILQAVAATRAFYGDPPALGMVTFIDSAKVRPIRVRNKETYGYTWLKAGFEHVGYTKSGLMAFQLKPEKMPFPHPAMPRFVWPWVEQRRR